MEFKDLKKSDSLDFVFPDWGVDNRTAIWLWAMAFYHPGTTLRSSDFHMSNIRHDIKQAIDSLKGAGFLIDLKRPIFIPESGFDWVEKKGRQPNWLIRLFGHQVPNVPLLYPESITPKETLILLFDKWDESLPRKAEMLDILRKRWVQHQREDKKFSWYADPGKEKQKCQLAWQWYQENHEELCRSTLEFSKLMDVLVFLDGTNLQPDAKLHHLNQIKKKYKAQQTYANRQGKKQTNISLSDEARLQLDELARAQGRTKTGVIEQLIFQAHSKDSTESP
ncbi:CopG family transcriptional regulator [Castellaniella sp.]|uniref:ribbon-helix-helix domain-containing protein n=1 Tax=Castellaniella sp. TaxID=1955812 RepID=UPI003C73C554